MFFRRRLVQAEYFDSPDRPAAELAEAYGTLAGMNRLFCLKRTFQTGLPKLLGAENCRSVSVLDLGAGDGSLGNELQDWAARHGWDWRVTNLDPNFPALQLNPGGRNVAGSALALPFRDGAFDAVIASQMAHHLLTDADVCRHFREAWRVARAVVLLNDLHRNLGLYLALGAVLRLRRAPGHFISDALVSVRRGWRLEEWRELAARAGIPGARVSLYAGARIILEARKES